MNSTWWRRYPLQVRLCIPAGASTRRKNSASPPRPMQYATATATTTLPKAVTLDEPTVHQQRIEQIDTDIDNLRAAFAWSRAHAAAENTLRLESSLFALGRSPT